MQTITDKLEIERLLSRLTTYIANKLHLSTMAAVGAVCMSKVANELAGGKIPAGTTFEDLGNDGTMRKTYVKVLLCN